MASLPYLVYGIITDTDATKPNNAKVTIRNDTNGEKINVYTNSSGQYVADIGNLASGYLESDRVTAICRYGDAEIESSFLLSDYSPGHQVNMTLVATVESTDCTYCQPQDVLEELGDKTTDDISYTRLRKIILRAESEIDERSGTSWQSNTATNEVYDFNQYTSYKSPDQLINRSNDLVGPRNDYYNTSFNDRIVLNNKPVISVTSLYKNTAGISSTDNWEALTQQTGSGGDYIVNLDIGTVTFVNNIPAIGTRKIKVTYTYGASSVPRVVEKLAILLSVRDVLMSKGNSSQMDTIDSISLGGEVSISKGISGSISYFDWLIKEIDRLWLVVGDLGGQETA